MMTTSVAKLDLSPRAPSPSGSPRNPKPGYLVDLWRLRCAGCGEQFEVR